jgi:chromosome segregation ATPase
MSEQPPAKQTLRKWARRLRPTRSLVGRIDTRVDRTMRQHDTLRATVERQAKQIERLQATVAKMNERALPVEQDAKTRMIQHGRMSVQVGMLEKRMGELEERLSTGRLVGDDADLAEAHNVLDLVRREHERIRVRLQLVSHYEERLRRVEAAIESIAEGDVRRMV